MPEIWSLLSRSSNPSKEFRYIDISIIIFEKRNERFSLSYFKSFRFFFFPRKWCDHALCYTYTHTHICPFQLCRSRKFFIIKIRRHKRYYHLSGINHPTNSHGVWEQSFLNFNVHKNHLKILQNTDSDSVGLELAHEIWPFLLQFCW